MASSDSSLQREGQKMGEPRYSTTDYEDDTYEMHEGAVPRKYQGTAADRKDMSQLGKVQELRRNFKFLSLLGFGCTLISTWEVISTTLPTILTDGGTAGLLWGFVITFFGFLLVYLSVAEMASMAPTSGGQYHWVSEFAPQRAQKFLSYIVGWLCFTGWQSAITSICFLTASVIQGLIALNNPTYVPQQWHATLLIIAIAAFAIIFNTMLAKKLPLVEGLLLILHVLGVFAIIIPLWVMSPLAPAEQVWTEFTNEGGWNSYGTATLVGMVSPIVSLIGFDCVVHMSEEVKDASRTLPKALLASYGFNAVLGFVTAITFAFCLGDVTSILESAAGPPIQIFYNSTGSLAGASVMSAIIIFCLTASAIAEVATASRQLWSFARDKGIPFSGWVAHITHGSNIPLNAVLISMAVTTLLSLINIGSTAALNAVLSLAGVSLLTSYIIVIGCLLLKRLRGEPLPTRRWSLGKFGMAVNIGALCWLLPMFVFVFFPVVTPVDAVSMNYACVMYGGIISFAVVYYFLYGRKEYIAPVALVKREYEH